MLLRHYLAQGVSKSALARQLGINRDTIHRWIRDGDLDRDLDATAVRYGPRPAVPSKLDAYKGIIAKVYLIVVTSQFAPSLVLQDFRVEEFGD